MKTVNILSNYSSQLALLFKFCQIVVGRVWFCIRINQMFLVKIVKFFRIFQIHCMGNKLFRREMPVKFNTVHSIGTSEVRNSGFCRYSCPSKKYNFIAAINYFLKFFYFIHIFLLYKPWFL